MPLTLKLFTFLEVPMETFSNEIQIKGQQNHRERKRKTKNAKKETKGGEMSSHLPQSESLINV